MTVRTLSRIHAPVLGRHGWIEQRPYPNGGTQRQAPADCPAVATHAEWRWGFHSNHLTPPGYHTTAVLSPSWCIHRPAPAKPAQGVLF